MGLIVNKFSGGVGKSCLTGKAEDPPARFISDLLSSTIRPKCMD